jgi:hypothetical protein
LVDNFKLVAQVEIFLYSMPNADLRKPDARSLKGMLIEHIHIFQTPIDSIATDKGYYSKDNEQLALDFEIKKIGIKDPIVNFDMRPLLIMSKRLKIDVPALSP